MGTALQDSRCLEAGCGEEVGGDSGTRANKHVVRTASRQSGGRRNRLRSHVLLGLLMAGVALAGYAFLGPGANASSRAGKHPSEVATNVPVSGQPQASRPMPVLKSLPTRTPVVPAIGGNLSGADAAQLQAEMDELTRRVNALKANIGPGVAAPGSGTAGGDYDVVLYTLESMMSSLDNMMTSIDARSSQTSRLR